MATWREAAGPAGVAHDVALGAIAYVLCAGHICAAHRQQTGLDRIRPPTTVTGSLAVTQPQKYGMMFDSCIRLSTMSFLARWCTRMRQRSLPSYPTLSVRSKAPGGVMRSCTRCTFGALLTPTATARAIWRESGRTCRTWPSSASMRSGSTRGTRRRWPTPATTSLTTARLIPLSGPSGKRSS